MQPLKTLGKIKVSGVPGREKRSVTQKSWSPTQTMNVSGKPLGKQAFACLAGFPHCTIVRAQRYVTACLVCSWTSFKTPASLRCAAFSTISCPLHGQPRALSKRNPPPFYSYICLPAWPQTMLYYTVESYGILWIPTDPYRILWDPMESYGFLWIAIDSYGILRIPYGILWNPIDSYRFHRIL